MATPYKGNRSPMPFIIVMAVVVLFVAWGGFFKNMGKPVVVSAKIPVLSEQAQVGRTAFNARCASCHGTDAMGGKTGPPLLYPFYRPADFEDARFKRAVTDGAPKRHWKMGAMAAMPEVAMAEIDAMLVFIREAQAANGMGPNDG